MEEKEIKAKISNKLSVWYRVYLGIFVSIALCITIIFSLFGLNIEEIMLVIIVPCVVFCMVFCGLPVLIAIRKRKLTKLAVSTKEAYGSYTAFIPIAMISLKMPINKIDNVSLVKSVFHIFGGKTIVIRSTSAKIKIPFVENADEVVAFISEAIEQAKNKREHNVAEQSITPPTDVTDSIKKLAELKDSGIITEEEFNQKKSDLLNKM